MTIIRAAPGSTTVPASGAATQGPTINADDQRRSRRRAGGHGRDAAALAEAELNGNITGYAPGSHTFSVRGVLVDLSRAIPSAFPNTGLSDGL